jgi:hypothetical protein
VDVRVIVATQAMSLRASDSYPGSLSPTARVGI